MMERLFSKRRQALLTREQVLGARPVRNGEAAEEARGDGLILSVPVELGWFMRLLWRMSSKAGSEMRRRVELDAAGKQVWRMCDGARTVGEIARRVAETYNVSLDEARASTVLYIRLLAERGLVALNFAQHAEER
jgi:hypothetical protein